MPQTPAGARFNTWLARAAITTRERAGLRREDIASLSGAGIDSVARFERGQQQPRELEAIIAAYAESGGLTTIELYQRAVDLWRAHGTEHVTGPAEATADRPRFQDEREDDAPDAQAG